MYSNQLALKTLYQRELAALIAEPTLTALMGPAIPMSVWVMDNATFHKRSDTKNTLSKAGHILEYLPPYSPDYNPIEKKWAQAKATRRREQCTTEELFHGAVTESN